LTFLEIKYFIYSLLITGFGYAQPRLSVVDVVAIVGRILLFRFQFRVFWNAGRLPLSSICRARPFSKLGYSIAQGKICSL